MANKKFLEVKEGMRIKLKDNIRISLDRHGTNREKKFFAGSIRDVTKVLGQTVYLGRTYMDRTDYRTTRDSWKFWIGDIESIVFDPEKECEKSETYTFDPKQLVT